MSPLQSPSTPDTSLVLQPETFDLWGSRLIEASAGTGKTWTIAALYVRLVLGHGAAHGFERPLRPSEILVMTFTRAATRELSDRIRERLLVAAQWFRGQQAPSASDPFLQSLLADYPAGPAREHAAWLLALAAEGMDDAAVHTIDAWCQRMLKEHAFDSGCLFDEALVADEEAMRLEAAQDYWRQSCYPLAQDALLQVLEVWRDVDALVKDMKALLGQGIAAQAGVGTLEQVLQQALAERKHALDQIKTGWAERAASMQSWLDAQLAVKNHSWDGRKLSAKNYSAWLNTLAGWADGTLDADLPALTDTAWERFTPDGLLKARKADAPPITLPAEFAAFAQLKPALDKLPSVKVALRRHAAAQVAQRLLQLKRQTGSFGFADMLTRLNTALASDNGARLRERMLAQYPVVLIDEFQDTSPLQYQIFDRVYRTQANDAHSALILIGDPKQSIYGFRGADIYSYLQARRATAGRHYVLETNFRSTEALVGAVNHWFAQADAARSEGAFMYREGADNPLPFVRVRANGRQEVLCSASGAVPAMTLVHDLVVCNADAARKRFAARCAEQIAIWLNDAQTGFARTGQPLKALRPADIAVLVRTGKEANAVRRELAARAIASVYLSDQDSVFASEVARDLLHWLRAVAAPQDVRLVRAGLATRTIGLSLMELGGLASNDDAFDARSAQLRQLRSTWQTQGVLAMLRQSLHQLDLAARWLQELDGERKLTNFLHLAELLQGASSTLDGEQALIRWLQTEITAGGARGDEQVVRLESDADLVKVITIHKSKGLEYAVVCLPFATSFRKMERARTPFVSLADAQGKRALQLEFDDEALALADRDRLREDLRLLYVALTRARHALWLGFSALKVGNSEACVSHQSAAGYVLGGTEPIAADDWLAHLEQCASAHSGIVLQAALEQTACTPLAQTSAASALHERPDYQAAFERNWKIGSFSQLTRDLAALPPGTGTGSSMSVLQLPRPADDEPESPQPADDTQAPLRSAPGAAAPQAWHLFPKGAEAGNFLHDQLEWLSTEGFALPGNDTLAQRLQRRCERAGREKHADGVVAWLSAVVQTRLPGPQASLQDLEHVLPEMEFWLPADHIEARAMDAHCRSHVLPGVERPALAERQLHGMLMGFADLVFTHQGRYWVLDYKSNYLGEDDAAYSADALAHAMAQHRYDVQAAIYMLALHRLLQQRLGANYDPAEHLGGAVYLFLRGIQGPENGVCLIPASLPLMEALAAMLHDAGAPA
jgi:exodeoxyribonuclease V beta subunit